MPALLCILSGLSLAVVTACAAIGISDALAQALIEIGIL